MSNKYSNGLGCDPSDCASCPGGCGSPQDIRDRRTITLTLEDDTEVECAILTIYPIEDKEYIALLPLAKDGLAAENEVYLYAFTELPTGEPMLENIEDDDEYQRAAAIFDEILRGAQLAAAADPEEE